MIDIERLGAALSGRYRIVRQLGEVSFSPDGRWLAYQSNETGRDEVHVRPFPVPGALASSPRAVG